MHAYANRFYGSIRKNPTPLGAELRAIGHRTDSLSPSSHVVGSNREIKKLAVLF